MNVVMDALEQEIESRRAERARCIARIAALDIEIPAFERAAALRPISTDSDSRLEIEPDNETPSDIARVARRHGGGRRPGDISNDWRVILREMHKQPSPLSYQDIADIASRLGFKIQMASVRDRTRNLLRSAFLSGAPESGSVVTQVAVKRFGFAKENAKPAGFAEANAEEGSDFLGVLKPQPSPAGAHD